MKVVEKLTPVLILAIVLMAFVIGALWQKVNILEKGTDQADQKVAGAVATPAPQIPGTGKLSPELAKKVPVVSENDHIRGNRGAKVKIIEYSDYYCPFCSRFHPTAKQALTEYGDKVAWVYRHFPLDTLHPNARAVAELSECVASLGGEDKFWDFTDKLYENSPADVNAALSLAATFGVDKSELEKCYKDGKFKDKVSQMYQSGADAGVTGTPGSFVVNDKGDVWALPGAVPIGDLKSAIDKALE